jgi:hypothetical protein
MGCTEEQVACIGLYRHWIELREPKQTFDSEISRAGFLSNASF